MARTTRARALIACAIGLVAFVASAIAQEMLQLGQQSYSRAAAPALRMPVTRSAGFFIKVGGVAFDAVAEGENGLKVVGLKYDAAAPDGDRLLITLESNTGRTTVKGWLHDWQLVPIARFAKDENGSAMTLFGQLEDKALERRTLRKGERVINYHPALDNTLVGLRLFHADILIIQPNAVHLFQQGGKVVLGAGEAGHDPDKNMERFRKVGAWQAAQSEKGLVYQSYVVGDLGQRVTFRRDKDRIAFTGAPFWNAWRPEHSAEVVAERTKASRDAYRQQIEKYNALVDMARKTESSMSDSEKASMIGRLKSMRSQIELAEKKLDAEVEALSGVQQMPQYSAELSQLIRQQQGINPIVYATVTKVMHYRALFKHYQRNDPAAYEAFVNSLRNVAVSPGVTTPTIQHALQ